MCGTTTCTGDGLGGACAGPGRQADVVGHRQEVRHNRCIQEEQIGVRADQVHLVKLLFPRMSQRQWFGDAVRTLDGQRPEVRRSDGFLTHARHNADGSAFVSELVTRGASTRL